MQKKFIALAVASLVSGAAFAQTNVTIYGVGDLSETFVSSKGADNSFPGFNNTATNQSTVARLDNNSSYVGFKGSEALGNGLTAVFQFETGINADIGGWGGGRDTYLGLAGGFGTVVAGNLTHPLRAMGSAVELLPGAAGVGTTASLTGTIAGVKTGADDRAQNAVAYVSPSFSGFTGTVAFVNGEYKSNSNQIPATAANPTGASIGAKANNSFAWQLAGQYTNGPIYAGIGYHQAKDTRAILGSNGNDDTAKIWRLAGTYTLPSATKLTALWDNTKQSVDYRGLGGSTEAKRNAYSLGVSQGFGKNTVGLEYAHSNKISGSNCDVNTGGVLSDCGDTAKNMWTALYSYELSKRTMLHARYSIIQNKYSSTGAGIDANFYNNPVTNNGNVVTGGGADFQAFGVGLRHTF